LISGVEEVRLAIYSVVERQRQRLIEYGRMRRQHIEPVEEIDFTAFKFGSNDLVSVDRGTISSEDLRVFKEEIRVNFIRLLPPNVLTQITELHGAIDNKFPLRPVLFENDVVTEFDDDEETVMEFPTKSSHKRN